jgi:hypothetical protein
MYPMAMESTNRPVPALGHVFGLNEQPDHEFFSSLLK